jgi:hypothetical protein
VYWMMDTPPGALYGRGVNGSVLSNARMVYRGGSDEVGDAKHDDSADRRNCRKAENSSNKDMELSSVST